MQPDCTQEACTALNSCCYVACRYSLEAQEGLQNVHSPSGLDKQRVQLAVRKARLVFATCAGAGSKLLANASFSMVVVDEASQVRLMFCVW